MRGARVRNILRLMLALAALSAPAVGIVATKHGSAVSAGSPRVARPGSVTVAPESVRPPVESLGVSQPEGSFAARILVIDEGIRARMGTSWRSGCPVPLEDLRVIEMTFWGFDGLVHEGELMVHRRYANDVLGVFRKLFDARFPIERMVLANGYMGNDPPLALRNNTAGFNCRRSVGSSVWSEHAFGRALDINPDQNPYVSPSGRIEPPFGRRWVDRSLHEPGMIRAGDPVVAAFRAIGWRWGGNHRRSKDWMHFSANGR